MVTPMLILSLDSRCRLCALEHLGLKEAGSEKIAGDLSDVTIPS